MIDLPRRQRQILDDLVRLAGDIVARPATRFSQRARVVALSEEIQQALARPMIDERFVDSEAGMLVQTLGHMVAATGSVADPTYVRWAKVAGVLLPDIHAAAVRAFEAEGGAP